MPVGMKVKRNQERFIGEVDDPLWDHAYVCFDLTSVEILYCFGAHT